MSPRQRSGLAWWPVVLVGLTALSASAAEAQVEAELPTLRGIVLRSGAPLAAQPMALHRVSSTEAGEVASSIAAEDGSFSFDLPSVPGGGDEVYFVSTRHQGILYFGAAVSDMASTDSVHTLVVYDTLSAPQAGFQFELHGRNIFVEEFEDGWRVTDVFDLHNDSDRTVVAREDGATWSYPLMEGAHDVELGDGDLSPDVWSFEDGRVVTRAPVPPGSRSYVFRYQTPAFASLPLTGVTQRIDLLVREPAAPFSAIGLQEEQPVEIEPGSTFRRYAALTPAATTIEFTASATSEGLPLGPMMVGIALALGMLGVWGVGRVRSNAPQLTRAGVLLEVARLDEEFERRSEPTPAQAKAHTRRREALLRRLPEG